MKKFELDLEYIKRNNHFAKIANLFIYVVNISLNIYIKIPINL